MFNKISDMCQVDVLQSFLYSIVLELEKYSNYGMILELYNILELDKLVLQNKAWERNKGEME